MMLENGSVASIPNKTSSLSMQDTKEAFKDIMSQKECCTCVRNLNVGYRRNMYNCTWCKTI